ncbi:50S ribosomal protein L32 [Anaplasma phagocytophilum str. CRT38]|uniref:Large ribosomal subunit protein bL32 n=1 Tax=Anaplasma phagocytophilum str. CRT38 TaxID=1269275 RepID=S6G6P2_ANAPH|nr:50S ribosomal protein L32 [Anaplasma phagocytophilum str. CRT38]
MRNLVKVLLRIFVFWVIIKTLVNKSCAMAVPKRKKSKSRRNMHRSHLGLVAPNVVIDPTTGEYKLSHHVCLGGYYNGKQVAKSKV